ncbi:hypothetical protein NM688_g3926 [Phlebia brevispora]|uniref:Uncharacterized protein n=1 Tax=Phlebia brevispora TaxID=194682 RepID=A0ACC1T4K3_9APHY|nr:hypothetical protein NM688_g3926 [Phlebia brevispora]
MHPTSNRGDVSKSLYVADFDYESSDDWDAEGPACPVEYKTHDALGEKSLPLHPASVQVHTVEQHPPPAFQTPGHLSLRSGSWEMSLGRRGPRLRVNVGTTTASPTSLPPNDAETNTKRNRLSISVFRAYQMQLHVHSPTVKVMRRRGYEPSRTMPVYGDHDTVEGMVLLDPQLCTSPGRLTVSLEGSFLYVSPSSAAHEGTTFGNPTEEYQHRFLFSSLTFPVGESASPRSTTSIREALANTVRARRVDRRPSLPELASGPAQFPFSFELPQPTRQGEELPQSCSAVSVGELGTRGRTCVERAEVEYKVVAVWESNEPNDRRLLEAPLLLQPEADFQSLDGLSMEPTSWLEIPLHADRPIPFRCATRPVFLGRHPFLFFVVFTTRPRSPLLAREIAADATITVSLIRQVHVYWSTPASHSPTSSCSSSGDESDAPVIPKRRLLHRVVKSAPPIVDRDNTSLYSGRPRFAIRDKPLPPIPANKQGISDTRSLQTEVSIGFPKRPRTRVQPHERHPSLDVHSSLPDGLYKGKLQLGKNVLPSTEWGGLSVKVRLINFYARATLSSYQYYVEASVLFGQDELRVRVPVHIS